MDKVGRLQQQGKRLYYVEPGSLKCMEDHAIEAYPLEACGVLAASKEDPFTISRTLPTSNAASQDPQRRYLVEPRELLHIFEQLEKEKRDVVGFYHSHPDHPPLPSSLDRQWAWEGYLYIIISVEGGRKVCLKGWIWAPEKDDFIEASINSRHCQEDAQ
jgi:proteasome lid subunit RPN8/RPN11